MKKAFGIHWFRRDLRIEGNTALHLNHKKFEGRVLCVFCFDKKFLSRPDFSNNRFQFFLETLKVLKEQIEDKGGTFLFLDVGPKEAYERLFSELENRKIGYPELITFNRDYEPYATERDTKMEAWFKSKGVLVHSERDHLVLEPHEIQKKSDPTQPFQIFTPFSKSWLELFHTPGVQSRLSFASAPKAFSKIERLTIEDCFETYYLRNKKCVTVELPKAGHEAALNTLKVFQKKIPDYHSERDVPARTGTSHLSVYLKNGSITTSQILAKLKLEGKGEATFLKELIWREFYYYILAKHPDVEKESFNPKYRKLNWPNKESFFKAWKEGKTGFPIVDAGMRQLNQTGWMHNRVRMIVASFLTKDLLIDWRWGERYFMEKLLDGDLAANNGGWQWAASTGCDPQPYFRIFNPDLQTKKFDPNFEYIRKYVPEFDTKNYMRSIVNHSEQREKALKLYKNL